MTARLSSTDIQRFCFGAEISATRILLVKRVERLDAYRPLIDGAEAFGGVWSGLRGGFDGQPIAIVATGIGPSNVGDCVEALNCPAIILYSGTCGGLASGVEIGDYVVATSAVCGDGYSMHHGCPAFGEVSADSRLAEALRDELCGQDVAVHAGASFTTSSFVRELDPRFWERVPPACSAIEMGAAALYSAARATAQRAVACFWVTDHPPAGPGFLRSLPASLAKLAALRFEETPRRDLALLRALGALRHKETHEERQRAR